MPALAAIDVGSNAIRMVIGTVDNERRLTIQEVHREAVRLGQDAFTTGVISEEAIEQASDAFRKFRAVINRHGARWVKAVATSALREAQNKDLFIDRIAQASDIDVVPIGTEEEARLIHMAVARAMPLKNLLALLVDIGGGSTEITLVSDDTILSTESFKMGAVRLLQLLDGKRHGERQFNQMVREYIDASRKKIRKEIGTRHIDVCVGTGGNVESLGDLRKEIFKKERDTQLTAEELDTLVRRLVGLSLEERIQELRLRPDRADVIVPAALVLQSIVKEAGVGEVAIPRVGLKDGLLLDMIEELYGERKQPHHDQVIAAALQLGRKYMFDEQHGTTVARYAAQLFDQTKNLHNLGLDYRLLLEVAALLHDIGTFVNSADHHKHSLYLLTASPVIGLSADQMAIVANTARYHRKSFPKPQHDEFQGLASKQRVAVTKLASLLRLADAMDNEHASKVTSFSVEYRKPKFILSLKGEGDLLLERWALVKKSALLEETFSVKFQIAE